MARPLSYPLITMVFHVDPRLPGRFAITVSLFLTAEIHPSATIFRQTVSAGLRPSRLYLSVGLTETVCAVSNVIMMERRLDKDDPPKPGVRDRRYAIRYPFAADAEFIDLENGAQVNGITCDISLGGCFICTSKPLTLKARARFTLSRKGQTVKGIGVIRIVKARVGMGIEFLDLEPGSQELLTRWIDQLRQR